MLFTQSGNRVFQATQTNGEARTVEYTINDQGQAVIIAVDNVSVIDAPLPAPFSHIVHRWIAEHRASLHTHADFFGALAVGAGLFGLAGLAHNQQIIPHDAFTA